MKNQIVNSVTSYLSDITTRLNNFVKAQSTSVLPQSLFPVEDGRLTFKYAKLNQWNYLQYFEYLLKLDSTHPIRLEKALQPFTLKEDLEILKAVSSNPHKIAIKAIEELVSNKTVYKSNFRNMLIKRSFKSLKERHQFLSSYIKEPELKYLTSWLQVHGLETKTYINICTSEEFQKTGSLISVSQESAKKLDQIAEATMITMKRLNLQKSYESDSQENECDELLERKSPSKKVHKVIEPTCDINRVFQTPSVKIASKIEPPKAPKKIKEEQTIQNDIKQTPKKQRKIFHVVDAKRDLDIKEESEDHKNSQSQTQLSPIISQFKLFPDSQQRKQRKGKGSSQGKQKQDNVSELKAIVKQFTNQKMSSERILKILNDVSGDLTDLKAYLKTEDRKLLWKRLEDAVLRSHSKNTEKRVPDSGKRELTVQVLYYKLITDKGQHRVKRRIKYLGLQGNQNENTKSN